MAYCSVSVAGTLRVHLFCIYVILLNVGSEYLFHECFTFYVRSVQNVGSTGAENCYR